MVNKKLVKKAAVLATTVVVAGHTIALGADGMVIARILNPDIISTVYAAEENLGIWISDGIGILQMPENVAIPTNTRNADESYTLNICKGTIVHLVTNESNLVPLQSGPFAEVAMDEWGIIVNALEVGSQQIQFLRRIPDNATLYIASGESPLVQDGLRLDKVYTLNINVVEATPVATMEQAVATGVHPGVANGYYSYADNHKVVSADGRWEINLDQLYFLRKTSVPAPVVYYGEDGMLTVEAYNLSGVMAGCTILDNSYKIIDGANNTDGLYSDAGLPIGQYVGLGGGDNSKETRVEWKRARNKQNIDTVINVLPVRNITLGSAFANGAQELGLPERVTYYPTTFTVK